MLGFSKPLKKTFIDMQKKGRERECVCERDREKKEQ